MSETEPPVASRPSFDPAPWGLRGAILVPVMALGAQVLLAVLVGALARALLLTLDPNLADQPDELADAVLVVTLLPVTMAYSIITVALIHLSVTVIWRRPFFEALRLRVPTSAGLIAALLAGAGIAAAFVGVTIRFPPDPEEPVGGPVSRLVESGGMGHVVWLTMAVLIAPIVEELLFRGYAFLGARRRLGAFGAGAGVTIVFVALHLGETGTYWPAVAGIATMAGILAAIMQRTENLSYCIACHLGYNATLALLTLLSIGGDT